MCSIWWTFLSKKRKIYRTFFKSLVYSVKVLSQSGCFSPHLPLILNNFESMFALQVSVHFPFGSINVVTDWTLHSTCRNTNRRPLRRISGRRDSVRDTLHFSVLESVLCTEKKTQEQTLLYNSLWSRCSRPCVAVLLPRVLLVIVPFKRTWDVARVVAVCTTEWLKRKRGYVTNTNIPRLRHIHFNP